MIRRTVISRDNDIILRLYKAFVRPHLEFAYEFGIHIWKGCGSVGRSAKKGDQDDKRIKKIELWRKTKKMSDDDYSGEEEKRGVTSSRLIKFYRVGKAFHLNSFSKPQKALLLKM